MLSELKDRFKSCSKNEQIQILTLFTNNFKRADIETFFDTTRRKVDKAQELKKEKGILSYPDLKVVVNKKIGEDVKALLREFYTSNSFEHVRILPGAKDYVSLSKGVRAQKILLLSNLKELYQHFKELYYVKIGFSMFCNLRPKNCVLPGDSGTRSTYVCIYHQNIKLFLEAIDHNLCYKEIISKIVCSTDNADCMRRLCFKCSDEKHIKDILTNYILLSGVTDFEESISYKQWTQTDRSQLVTLTNTYEDLLDILHEKFNDLIPHSYIAKKQTKYLKDQKERLSRKKAIALLDFSENYEMKIQDEIQSSYWSRKSCTVHPTVIYVRNEQGELEQKSLCFLSEDLKHDVNTVNVYIKYITEYIKKITQRWKKLNIFLMDALASTKTVKIFGFFVSINSIMDSKPNGISLPLAMENLHVMVLVDV